MAKLRIGFGSRIDAKRAAAEDALYHERLCRYSPQILTAAVDRHLDQSAVFPSVSHLVHIAEQIAGEREEAAARRVEASDETDEERRRRMLNECLGLSLAFDAAWYRLKTGGDRETLVALCDRVTTWWSRNRPAGEDQRKWPQGQRGECGRALDRETDAVMAELARARAA